ncbi:MAG: 16S rRNA (cytidine(1402)-2'-O)-methyltransferase [Tepidiformaceae bacterium]
MNSLAPGLYVVATPIGNLGDASDRCLAVLRAAAIVAAEDTRTSGRLLQLADGSGRMVSLTEHNVAARAPALVEAAATSVVVLVSDAGTPVVADPGARLMEAAHAAGVAVFAVPGPSALTAALSVSGFEGADVHFLGFLPRRAGERAARLGAAAKGAGVLVFFESPNRVAGALAAVAEALGDPETVVCREMTKIHEEVVRGRASELAARFAQTKGECTVVVRCERPGPEASAEAEVAAYLAEMKRAGARRAGAAAEAARRFGVARRRAYDLWGAEGDEPGP